MEIALSTEKKEQEIRKEKPTGTAMDYKCTLCGKVMKDDLKEFIDHTETHVVDEIKKDHPDWVEKNGICHKCVEYYRQQIRGHS